VVARLLGEVAVGLLCFGQMGHASTAQRYDALSSTYDAENAAISAAMLGVSRLRAHAGSFVRGDTLEVAIGTGLQAPFYDWSEINSLTAIDQSRGMLEKAHERLEALPDRRGKPFKLETMDATTLLFESNSFDSVVDTFSLCVIDDPFTTIQEMARVVKPRDGRVILVENLKSDNTLLGAIQDVTEPFITATSRGKCRWNVDVQSMAHNAGLELEYSERESLGTLALQVFRKLL